VRRSRVPEWRAPRTKFFAAKLGVAKEAEGVEESKNRSAGCATPREGGLGPTRVSRCQKHRGASSPGKGAQSPVERPEEEQRISCRRKASWTGKSFVASRRRGGSGLGGFHRIGSARTAKMRSAGIEWGSRQGRQRLGHARTWARNTWHGSNRPPRSTRDPLKRSVRRETHGSPVSEGGIPRSTRPAKSR